MRPKKYLSDDAKQQSVDIVVLYEGLKLVRVAWDLKNILSREGVIALAICAFGKRYQSSIHHDYYQLVWTDIDCCLTGHDGDYGFFSLTEPGVVDRRFPFILPENSIEFHGVYVSKDEYNEAKLIFADLNGGMF